MASYPKFFRLAGYFVHVSGMFFDKDELMPFALTVSGKLKQIALAFAPTSLTEKANFLRPITIGRIAFSAGRLSISI
nr:hypothetical protein [Lysinibacillus mangiferihumi]